MYSIPAAHTEREIFFYPAVSFNQLLSSVMISISFFILMKCPGRICSFLKHQHEAFVSIFTSVHPEMHALMCAFLWIFQVGNRWEWCSTTIETGYKQTKTTDASSLSYCRTTEVHYSSTWQFSSHSPENSWLLNNKV